MSAGDVKFIGWTGTNPPYQELPPQIQIEPAPSQGNIQKRVTINRVCFDKNKAAVIGNLPVDGAFITSKFVNQSGSIENAALGGGYRLLNVTDTQISKGFSRISATYTKTNAAAFDVGLPEGLSIVCENGVGKIKYLNTVLEEYDSGMGECVEGLEIIKTKDIIFPPITNPQLSSGPIYAVRTDDQKTDPVDQKAVQGGYFFCQQDEIALEYQIKINGIVAETIPVKFSELGAGSTNNSVDYFRNVLAEGVQFDFDLTVNLSNAEVDQIANTLFQNPDVRQVIDQDALTQKSEVIGVGWNTFRYPFSPALFKNTYYRIFSNMRFRWTDCTNINRNQVYARWNKTENIIKLLIGQNTVKEYDITGLT
jgi:hypothetical protein